MYVKKNNLVDIYSLLETNYTNLADIQFRLIEFYILKKLHDKYKFDTTRSIDIGCGNGFIFANLFGCPSTYGIDNDEAGDALISLSSQRTKKLFCIDASTAWPEEIIDLSFAFSNCVIEHIPKYQEVLANTYSSLEENGHFLFTVPTDEFENYMYPNFIKKIPILRSVFKKLAFYRAKSLNHYNQYSVDFWERKLSNCGFKLVDFEYYHGRNSIALWNILAVVNRFIPSKLCDQIRIRRIIGRLSISTTLKSLSYPHFSCVAILACKK